MVRYEVQNMSAQNQASLIVEATAQQELRALLSNQCLLCLLWHLWGCTAGLYGVYSDRLYMKAAESLSMACNS